MTSCELWKLFLSNILLQLDTISLLVKVSHELAQVMTTYDFLLVKQAILSNVRNDFNLTYPISLLVNF